MVSILNVPFWNLPKCLASIIGGSCLSEGGTKECSWACQAYMLGILGHLVGLLQGQKHVERAKHLIKIVLRNVPKNLPGLTDCSKDPSLERSTDPSLQLCHVWKIVLLNLPKTVLLNVPRNVLVPRIVLRDVPCNCARTDRQFHGPFPGPFLASVPGMTDCAEDVEHSSRPVMTVWWCLLVIHAGLLRQV